MLSRLPTFLRKIMNPDANKSGSVVQDADARPQNAWPGVTRRLLVHDAQMMLCEHRFEADTDLPAHAHPHAQITYLLSGRLRFVMEGREPFDLGPGDSVLVPGGIAHEARALEPTVVLDVFTPAREDYIGKG